MNIRSIAALLATSALVASISAAQTAASVASFVDPANGVSLEQAIDRALAQEPSIRAARTTVDVARGMRLQAEARRNPSVSVDLRDEPSGSDSQTMVTMEWPLDLFRREGRIAVAEREVAAAALAVADRERLLIADVRARFGDALVAVRDLAVLEELVANSRRQYDLLRSRVEQGASPPLERDLDLRVARLKRMFLERLIPRQVQVLGVAGLGTGFGLSLGNRLLKQVTSAGSEGEPEDK